MILEQVGKKMKRVAVFGEFQQMLRVMKDI